jgi:hypothetical protein
MKGESGNRETGDENRESALNSRFSSQVSRKNFAKSNTARPAL